MKLNSVGVNPGAEKTGWDRAWETVLILMFPDFNICILYSIINHANNHTNNLIVIHTHIFRIYSFIWHIVADSWCFNPFFSSSHCLEKTGAPKRPGWRTWRRDRATGRSQQFGAGKSIGSWENHGKTMGKSWENHGKITVKSWDMYDMMGNSHGKWRCCMIWWEHHRLPFLGVDMSGGNRWAKWRFGSLGKSSNYPLVI